MICTALRQTEAWGPAHVELPDSELEELSDESWSEALSWLRAHRLPFSFARRIALMSETIFQNAAASPNVQICWPLKVLLNLNKAHRSTSKHDVVLAPHILILAHPCPCPGITLALAKTSFYYRTMNTV